MNNTQIAVDRGTFHFLLARFMDTEYPVSLLASVSPKNFDVLKREMFSRFNDCYLHELTEDDVKEAWKIWFDYAVDDGTLISADLCLPQYVDIRVHRQLAELAVDAIDKL